MMSDRPPVLLAVFAHPDDEAFRCGGTLALLARHGVQVQVLTATRGEAGSCGDPPLCLVEDLGSFREQELICSCKSLGISPPVFMDYLDGRLTIVNETEAVSRIIDKIDHFHPQVLLTWPADGLSGHSDHIAVSRWTQIAYNEMSSRANAPKSIYNLAMPVSVTTKLGLFNLHAIPDDEISITVDISPVWEQKMSAINCHHTQMASSPIMSAQKEKQKLFLGKEYFSCMFAKQDPDFIVDYLQN